MTTLQTLIDRTLSVYLQADKGTSRNKLASAVTDSDETLSFSRPLGPLGDGSKLSIGLEDIHVWSADTANKQADVDRGEYGSTAATHAEGAVVYVNTVYSPFEITQALNATVSALMAEGIYQVSEVAITTAGGVYGYDLASSTDVLGPNGAAWCQNLATSTKEWTLFQDYHFQMNADTSVFPSGTAVHIQGPIASGAVLRVSYRHELSATLAALDDVVETVTGLETDALNLLCIGAALHLTAGKEVQRNEVSVASNRPPNEVPASAWTQAPSSLRRLYRDGVKAEKARLSRKNPERLNRRSPLSGV